MRVEEIQRGAKQSWFYCVLDILYNLAILIETVAILPLVYRDNLNNSEKNNKNNSKSENYILRRMMERNWEPH